MDAAAGQIVEPIYLTYLVDCVQRNLDSGLLVHAEPRHWQTQIERRKSYPHKVLTALVTLTYQNHALAASAKDLSWICAIIECLLRQLQHILFFQMLHALEALLLDRD